MTSAPPGADVFFWASALISALTGLDTGDRIFTRCRTIDIDMKKDLVKILERKKKLKAEGIPDLNSSVATDEFKNNGGFRYICIMHVLQNCEFANCGWRIEVPVSKMEITTCDHPELGIQQSLMDYKRLGYSDNWIGSLIICLMV